MFSLLSSQSSKHLCALILISANYPACCGLWCLFCVGWVVFSYKCCSQQLHSPAWFLYIGKLSKIIIVIIFQVSAPGVWLPSKEPVYLSISLFNQYRNTACHDSVFPLLINEKFRFEKVKIKLYVCASLDKERCVVYA